MTDQKLGIIIQARMSSKRFPGKSMCMLSGRPMISYILESMAKVACHPRIILATSIDRSDDPLAIFAASQGQECFRGALDDVYGRFCEVIRKYEFGAFVRINGDSPLLDYRLVDQAIQLYNENQVALVTNVMPRSFPKGQSVEIIRSSTFLGSEPGITSQSDREHITQYFYNNSAHYNIYNFSAEADNSGLQLSVDLPEDFANIAEVINQMNRPHWEYSYVDNIEILSRVNASKQEGR